MSLTKNHISILLFPFLMLIATLSFGQQVLPKPVLFNIAYNRSDIALEKVTVNRSELGLFDNHVDTLWVAKGQFAYFYQFDEPERYQLRFYFSKGKPTQITFWATTQNLKIAFDENNQPFLAEKTDSRFQLLLTRLEKQKSEYEHGLTTLLNKISYKKRAIALVEKQIQLTRDSVGLAIDEKIYKQYIKDFPTETIALYALCQYADRPYENQRIKNNPDEITAMLASLSPQIRMLPSAKLLAEKADLAKKLTIGNNFFDVQLPDTSNVLHHISDYRGKFILVDFWASWCMPCREEFPYLLKAYKQYNQKGFSIIGISIDDKKQLWREAIRADQVGLWPQLIDTKGISKERYAVKLIPENYLLDPAGKIIAKNLKGEELENKLREIFSTARP